LGESSSRLGQPLFLYCYRKLPQPPARGILKSLVKDENENKDKDKDKDTADKVEVLATNSLNPPDKGKQNTTMSNPAGSDAQGDKFHVFSWLNTFTATGEPSPQEQAEFLCMQLQEMEDFLSNDTKQLDQRTYRACPEATRLNALTYLEQQYTAVQKNNRLKRDFEDRVDVFNAAERVFRFFLPLDFVGPTVPKFWGAIHRLVQVSPQGAICCK